MINIKKWIVNLYYRIFYKEIGKQVMGTLTNCEAYETCQKTDNENNRIIEEKMKSFIETLESEIKNRCRYGEYEAENSFNPYEVNSDKLKYLKKFYSDRGYKIKIRRDKYSGGKKRFIISWEHWRK